MPKRKKVDPARLIQAIQSGTPSNEIMKEFEIKTISQLKTFYVDALMAEGQAPLLLSGRKGRPQQEQNSKEIKVNKRGSLVAPKELIEELGFAVGDTFSVRRTSAGVSLKKN
ncbi:MAG: hypothetical protein V1816_06480 [Pseudomonadota bacterium]